MTETMYEQATRTCPSELSQGVSQFIHATCRAGDAVRLALGVAINDPDDSISYQRWRMTALWENAVAFTKTFRVRYQDRLDGDPLRSEEPVVSLTWSSVHTPGGPTGLLLDTPGHWKAVFVVTCGSVYASLYRVHPQLERLVGAGSMMHGAANELDDIRFAAGLPWVGYSIQQPTNAAR